MILAIIAAVLLGVTAGTLTGLFPGIHINLVSAALLSLIANSYFDFVEPIALAVFVVAMAISHTFIDFIPSIFLGAPGEDSFLSVLPGHQMLKEGRGYEAIVLTYYGGLIALPLILIFSFIFILFLDDVFELIKRIIPYIIIFVSLYLVFREKNFILAGIVFLLSGFLGLFVFNLPVKEPLLPLLSGLFGVSSLILSMKSKNVIPKQKILKLRKIKLGRKSFFVNSLAAAVSAPLCSFLPGIGSGHAAIIGTELSGDSGKDNRGFLFLMGAINFIVMSLSFVTAYAIGKTRTGASVAVQKILKEISTTNLIIILIIILVTGIVVFFVGISLAKFFSKNISKINYSKLSFFILILLFIVNLFLTNFIGVIVLITASALGVFTITSGVRRINLMGVLLLPTIVIYLTI